MSKADRDKWNQRYAAGSYADRLHPSALLAEWAPRLSPGRALDVACGAGRNSLYLSAAGWQVDAVDIAAEGLDRARTAARSRGLDVHFVEADLDARSQDPLGHFASPDGYDLIVLVRYVNASLWPLLASRLKAGGVLLAEQHVDAETDVVGPRSPAFRLRRGELLETVKRLPDFGALRVLHYSEGVVRDPDGRAAALARVALTRPSRMALSVIDDADAEAAR